MASVLIQGIQCEVKPKPNAPDVLYNKYRHKDQRFHRPKLPFTQDELADCADNRHVFTADQLDWINTENYRIDNGCYMRINGVDRYVPGSYYGYIAYWTLEDGSPPEYREEDRLFFIFFEQCYFREPSILGILRGKHRRLGATSETCWLLIWISTRNFNARCGIISKTSDDAKNAFVDMTIFGFKALPFFMQPRFDGSDDPKRKIVFAKPANRKKSIGGLTTKREGLNSSIEYKATALNSFDSGRLTLLLGDEFGKFEEVNCYTYWQIVRKTLVKGTHKVGFAIIPSTVNAPRKGGTNFKKLWDKSDQYKYGKNKTPTRLVKYFIDAAKCYAGCIDEYGNGMVEEAAEAIQESIDAQEVEEDRLEERRMLPRTEEDMFCFTTTGCEFDAARIEQQIDELRQNPVYLRSIRLYRGENDEVHFADDRNGGWLLLEEPETRNAYNERYGMVEPANTLYGIIGVDTFRSGFNSGGGSKGTVLVFKKSRIVEGIETGNYPVALYIGRPRLVTHFADEVLKAALWYGVKCNFEMDGGTFYYDHFIAERATLFLEWTPKITKDTVTQGKMDWKPGAESANPFQLAKQLEVAKMYVDGTDTSGYNGNVHRIKFPSLLKQLLEYDHANRTKSDEVIALMMALLPIIGYAKKEIKKEKPRPILKQYAVRMR